MHARSVLVPQPVIVLGVLQGGLPYPLVTRFEYLGRYPDNQAHGRYLELLLHKGVAPDDGIFSDDGTIQDRGMHADDALVLHRGRMDNGIVPDGDILSYMGRVEGHC